MMIKKVHPKLLIVANIEVSVNYYMRFYRR